MAFGAVVWMFIMEIVVISGRIGMDASIVGIIFSGIARKKGKTFAKPLLITSIVVGLISIVITCIPTVFIVNTLLKAQDTGPKAPATDIIIEERGYQDEKFTVNGVVYERIEIDDLVVIGGEEVSGPIFSYKEKSLFTDKWGAYQKMENGHGFNLVVGEGDDVFCPTDEKEDVEAFYNDDNNYDWYFDYSNYYNDLNDECQEALNELLETKKTASETVAINEEDCDKYFFQQMSNDNLFFKDEIEIFVNDGKYYLEIPSHELFGDTENPGTEVVEIEKEVGELLVRAYE